MIRDTSSAVYAAIVKGLSKKRGQVFAVFYGTEGRLCDRQLADELGWTINRITPRRGELEQMGYIQDAGKFSDGDGGKEVHFFELNPACLSPGWAAKELGKKRGVGASEIDGPRVLAKNFLDMHEMLEFRRNPYRYVDRNFFHTRLRNRRHLHRDRGGATCQQNTGKTE